MIRAPACVQHVLRLLHAVRNYAVLMQYRYAPVRVCAHAAASHRQTENVAAHVGASQANEALWRLSYGILHANQFISLAVSAQGCLPC